MYQGADYRTNARSIFSPFQPSGENSKVKALEMEKAATAGELQSFEWKHCRYDGSLFDAEVSLTRVQVNEDTVLLQAIIRDISQRKEAERKLRANEERYRTFIDATSDGVFLKDDKFRYLIVNKRLRSYFKKKEEEIIGKTDFEILSVDADRRRETDIMAFRSSSIVISEEAVNGRIYETRKFPVTIAENTRGIGAYVTDITARKKAEEELKTKSINFEEVNAALKGAAPPTGTGQKRDGRQNSGQRKEACPAVCRKAQRKETR